MPTIEPTTPTAGRAAGRTPVAVPMCRSYTGGMASLCRMAARLFSDWKNELEKFALYRSKADKRSCAYTGRTPTAGRAAGRRCAYTHRTTAGRRQGIQGRKEGAVSIEEPVQARKRCVHRRNTLEKGRCVRPKVLPVSFKNAGRGKPDIFGDENQKKFRISLREDA